MGRITAKDLKKREGSSGDGELYHTDADIYSIGYNAPTPRKRADPVTHGGWDESYFHGWDIPNFHRKVRQGDLLPHTPWEQFSLTGYTTGKYRIRSHSGDPSKWSEWYATGGEYCYTARPLTKELILEHTPDISDKYVQEAAAGIYTDGFDVLTFVAELTEVYRLFMNTAQTLLKLRIPRDWKSLSNEWLSARYGWRTLIYDMIGINEAIEKLNEKQRTRHSEKRWATSSTTTTEVFEWLTDSNRYYLRAVVTDHVTVSLRGSVTADIIIPAFQFNPVMAAWELIPFSFIIDWFVTIGKAIASASFLTFQTNYSASSGLKVEVVRDHVYEDVNHQTGYISGYNEGTGHYEGSIEIRHPCSVPLTPHLTLNIDFYKILDLLALIIQRFR